MQGSKTLNHEHVPAFLKPEFKEIWVTDFTDESAIMFHERIFHEFENDPYRPIIIHINSNGGEVDALFSMLDTMDIIRDAAPPEFKFLTVVLGKAQSAGAVLLSYGDHRFATPMARIMLHQIYAGVGGDHTSNEVEFREIVRMNDQLLEIIKKRCKLKNKMTTLKKKLSHNRYLTPKEAVEFGIIDIIGYPRVMELNMYDVRVFNGKGCKIKKTSRKD